MEAAMARHSQRTRQNTARTPMGLTRENAGALTVDPIAVRRMARIAFAILLVAAAIVVTVSRAYAPDRPVPGGWSSITVAQGSSLWDVAAANPIAGLSTPETIAVIRDANGLSSSTLLAGQVLRVPASSAPRLSVAAR